MTTLQHGPVRLATADETGTIAAVIAHAFAPLDVCQWLVPVDAQRDSVLANYFQILIDHAAKQGRIEVIDIQSTDSSTTVGAAAVWLEHSVPEPDDYADRVVAVCGEWTDRFEQFEAAMRNAQPIEPHAYLTLLAVDDRWQGRGLGTKLLEARHVELDTPSYLEASNSRSRKLYERMGYASCAAPLDLPYSGERIYPMWRKPPA